MSLLNSVKDVVLGQAMKVASDPRLAKLVTDPRLMTVAMKAMTIGGAVKGSLDQAGRMAGGVLGLASQEEISTLRGTVQNLEDQITILETRAAAAEAEAEALRDKAKVPARQKKTASKNGASKKKPTRKK